jgi:hypothetical protein
MAASGNNEYDADMMNVKMFVRSYQRPDDVLAQFATFEFYIGSLINQWNATKEYINSDDFRNSKRSYIREHLNDYEMNFLSQIEQARKQFDQNRIVDIINIYRIFKYISHVGCGETEIENLDLDIELIPEQLMDRLYPLPNTTGEFGINTYLYGLFEGIYLIGVPVRETYFDKVWGCPKEFINHDIDHSININYRTIEDPNKLETYRSIYDTIIHDKNLSSVEKQCFLMMLWVDIHEINFRLYQDLINGTFDSQSLIKAFSLYNNGVDKSLDDSLRKFTQLTMTESNLEDLKLKITDPRILNILADLDPYRLELTLNQRFGLFIITYNYVFNVFGSMIDIHRLVFN